MNKEPFRPSAFLASDDIVRRIQAKYARMFNEGESVLDLGCGNGVFLELLKQRNVHGSGVDSFGPSVEVCRQKDLDVHHAELMEFLQHDAKQYHGIFCSHIVEHLPADAVLSLIGLASRRLHPGGRLIVITPNTRNIDIIGERFWLDITHVRPYPVPLLEAMMTHHGMTIEKSGYDPDTKIPLRSKNPLVMFGKILKKARFGEFWGAGDSVVIGRLG